MKIAITERTTSVSLVSAQDARVLYNKTFESLKTKRFVDSPFVDLHDQARLQAQISDLTARRLNH